MWFKFSWIIRRLIYALIFRKIAFYGYLGAPIVWIRPSKIELATGARIFPGSRLEVHSDAGRIIIGRHCSIGQNFHCTAIGTIKIGARTVITANVCVTDIAHDFEVPSVAQVDQQFIGSQTIIGENVFIGVGAVILPGTSIGDNCIIGANSVVQGDFSCNTVIAGVPAKSIKSYDPENGLWNKLT